LEKLKDNEWKELIKHVMKEMESELPDWVEDWLYKQKKKKLEDLEEVWYWHFM
jgi:hypothetical protein